MKYLIFISLLLGLAVTGTGQTPPTLETPRSKSKSFWAEVGTNFDLIDGPAPNNLFSGVFFHKREIRPFSFKKAEAGEVKEDRLSVFAGVFESKSVTSSQHRNFIMQSFYDSTSFVAESRDSINTYRGIGSIKVQKTVRNLGLFFAPQVRLTNGDANDNGFHVFASLWMELQWQQIAQESIYNRLYTIDTTRVSIKDAFSNPDLYSTETTDVTDIRSHYFGLGVPIFFIEADETNSIHLFVNSIVGITNQPTQKYLRQIKTNAVAEIINREWKPFYVMQFRLNEENYGISFTGEVRGLFNRNNPPIVSIALSKKFDLTKFVEFNK